LVVWHVKSVIIQKGNSANKFVNFRLQETEKEVGSIEQLNRDVLEIEEKKSVLTDKSNQLTKILMNVSYSV